MKEDEFGEPVQMRFAAKQILDRGARFSEVWWGVNLVLDGYGYGRQAIPGSEILWEALKQITVENEQATSDVLSLESKENISCEPITIQQRQRDILAVPRPGWPMNSIYRSCRGCCH